jgi:hypothetical protein
MKLSTKPRPRWLVHVFTPGGQAFANIEARSRNAQDAIKFAKKRVYKMGKLAHFYSYCPVDRENQSQEV